MIVGGGAVDIEAPEPRVRRRAVEAPVARSRASALIVGRLRPGASLEAVTAAWRAIVDVVSGWDDAVLDLRCVGSGGDAPALEVALVLRSWGRPVEHTRYLEALHNALPPHWADLRPARSREVRGLLSPLGEGVRSCAWVTRGWTTQLLADGSEAWLPRPLIAAPPADDRSHLWSLLTAEPRRCVLSVATRPIALPEGIRERVAFEIKGLEGRASRRRISQGLFRGAGEYPGDPAATVAADALRALGHTSAERTMLTRILVAGEGRHVTDLAAAVARTVGGTVFSDRACAPLAERCLAEVDLAHPQGSSQGPLGDLLFALSQEEVARALRPPVHAHRAVAGMAAVTTAAVRTAIRAPAGADDSIVRADEEWVGLLPEPLSAPLVRLLKVADHDAQAQALRRFFENVAMWRFVVLAAPVHDDTLHRLAGTGARQPLTRPEFGAWEALGRTLAQRLRKRLAAGEIGAILEELRTTDRVLVDALGHEELDAILELARPLRNESVHGQVHVLGELQRLLDRLRAAWPSGLGTPRLFASGVTWDLGDGTVGHQAYALSGITRFKIEDVFLNQRVPTDRLFLHEAGRTDALALPPAVRVDAGVEQSLVLYAVDGDEAWYCRTDGATADRVRSQDRIAADWARSVASAR